MKTQLNTTQKKQLMVQKKNRNHFNEIYLLKVIIVYDGVGGIKGIVIHYVGAFEVSLHANHNRTLEHTRKKKTITEKLSKKNLEILLLYFGTR